MHVKSDFVKDVLEKTPAWITTWGNLIFLFFIIGLIALASYIKYPEVLHSKVEIITETPPTSIVLKVAGELDTLYIKDKTEVEKGQLVAKIRSIENMQEVLTIKKKINAFPIDRLIANYNNGNNNTEDLNQLISHFQGTISDFKYKRNNFPKTVNLGHLSKDYTQLNAEFDGLLLFIKQNSTALKIKSLNKEIEKIHSLNQSLKSQQEIFKNEFSLTRKNFERNKKLNENEIISDVEKEGFEKTYFQQKRALENFETLQLTNELAIEEKKSTIKDFYTNGMDEYATRLYKIKECIRLLQSGISAWKENHLVYAPISGTISFNKLVTEKQFFESGEHICYVLPDAKANRIIGVSEMPLANSGKINIGNEVKIRLDAYPYHEFGVVEGKIVDIAQSPDKDKSGIPFRKVEIELKNNELKTAYGKIIPFGQKHTGTALIVKEKRSILTRLLESLYSLTEN